VAEAVSTREQRTVAGADRPPAPPTEAELEPEWRLGGPAPRPAPRHAARFALFTGALVFCAVAALALAFVFAATGGDRSTGSADTWSPFKPSSDGLDTGPREIADYVGRQYRLSTGEQIVAVTGGPLEYTVQQQTLPMRIAKRESLADGGDIAILEGKGVLYRMCGLADKCAIGAGKASPDRTLLLRREALELALYSLHYLDDVEHVVVFIPPAKGEDAPYALHFTRDDVAGPLARPLRATLPMPVPNPDTIAIAPNTPVVRRLTYANLFKFSLTVGNQDTNVFLVLDPLPTDS
jgi:hypothetical protein